MDKKDIFISVGATANIEQERFVTFIEGRLRSEGLITMPLTENATITSEFNGVLASWKAKLVGEDDLEGKPVVSPSTVTVGQLPSMLTPSQLWAILVAGVAALGGAFLLDGKLFL